MRHSIAFGMSFVSSVFVEFHSPFLSIYLFWNDAFLIFIVFPFFVASFMNMLTLQLPC